MGSSLLYTDRVLIWKEKAFANALMLLSRCFIKFLATFLAVMYLSFVSSLFNYCMCVQGGMYEGSMQVETPFLRLQAALAEQLK